MTNKTILIVEDNPFEIELTKEVIDFDNQNSSSKFIFATSYSEATPFLKDKTLCLVILDLNLSKENGKDILKTIKNSDTTKHIPVVVFSNSDSQNDINECYRLDANSYIKKPVEYEDFVNTFSKLKIYWSGINIIPDKRSFS